MIKTRLHILASGVNILSSFSSEWSNYIADGNLIIPRGASIEQINDTIRYMRGERPTTLKPASQLKAVEKMLASTCYAVDDKVMALLEHENVRKSLFAMLDAGIVSLPLPKLTIEYTLPGTAIHEFAYLEESCDAAGPFIEIWTASLQLTTGKAMVVDKPIKARYTGKDTLNPSFQLNDVSRSDAEIVAIVDRALRLSLLMLNTLGIEKEIVDTKRLNHSRQRKGKPPIPSHTIVHIGRIFKKDGTAVRFDTATGRKMPMHVRQAHVRNVPYGSRNVEGDRPTRKMLIPMCIVNFVPGEEIKSKQKILAV